MKKRIELRLAELGLSPRKASILAGGSPDLIRGLLRGQKGGFGAENLANISSVLQCRPEWILTGNGPKLPLTTGFDPDSPDPVHTFEAEEPDPIDPDALPKIPKNGVVELEAKAGMGDGQIVAHRYVRNGDEITTVDAIKPEYWQFPHAFLALLGVSPTRIVMIQAIGDSMEPTVPAGSMVMIDTGHTRVTPDGVYAIRDREGAIQIKRLETFGVPAGHVRIRSDRTNAAVDVSLDEMTVVGRVVLKMSAM